MIKLITTICLYLFAALEIEASCSNTNDEDTSTIKSPNYPSNYQNSKHCTWKITAPTNTRIKINRFRYSMESSSNCEYDSLKIYDGPTSRSNRKARLCGRRSYSGMISTSNTLLLIFNSDGSTRYTGFQLTYSVIGRNSIGILNETTIF